MNITHSIIEKIQEGRNIFITGSGGTGKSYQMNKIIKHFGLDKSIVACAATGTAAVHLNGITADRFFGTMGKSDVTSLPFIKRNSEHWDKTVNRITSVNLVIIDEISMIRSDKLDLMDLICRTIRRDSIFTKGNWEVMNAKKSNMAKIEHEYNTLAKKYYNTPFGGIQIIFSGDYLQLPPVVKKGEVVNPDYFGENQPWAFQAKSWKSANPFTIHLTEIQRQSDKEFIKALQTIRMGRVTGKIDKYIKARMAFEKDCEIKLFSKNEEAYLVNQEKLNSIDGCQIEFKATFTLHEKLEKKELSEEEIKKLYVIITKNTTMVRNLNLKKGVKVICLTNNDDMGYINGSIGTFERACSFIETYGDKGPKKKYELLDDLLNSIAENDSENPWYEWIGTKLAIFSKKGFELMEKNFHLYNGNGRSKISKREALLVRLKNNRQVFVERKSDGYQSGEIINDENNQIEADILLHQFPLKLAYALTIHKSQGMTLDEVEIDFSNCFADGSAYVALSRCKSYEGLYVKNWSQYAVKANSDALIFYNNLEG